MARPSKYTPATVERIVEAITMGATYELAAAYGGITYETFKQWMNVKPSFSEDIKAAEGEAAMQWLRKIEKAASEGNWQAAAWKLERRYPRDYGRTVQEQQHSGKIEIVISERAEQRQEVAS